MKVLVLFAFLALGGVMSQSSVTYSGSVDQAPSYGYAYDVHDPTTGDIKNHQEVRNGDAVSGSYSVVEADGTKRIVEYTADGEHGFNAKVHHEAAGAVAPVVAKHVAPASPYAYPAYPYAVKSVHAYPSTPVSGYAHPYAASAAHHAYPYASAAYAYPYAASSAHHAYPYASAAYAYPYAASSAHHAYPYASAAYAYPYAASSAHHAYPYASAAYAYPYAAYPYTPYYHSYPHHNQTVSPSTYVYAI